MRQLAASALSENPVVDSWPFVYTLSLSTLSHCPWCALSKGHGLYYVSCVALFFLNPPFGKVIFHTLHLLFTKHLLSAFSVSGSVNTEMNKTHLCAQDTPGTEETTQQIALHFLGTWAKRLGPQRQPLAFSSSIFKM